MKLTSLLPLLSWGTDKNERVNEKDLRLLNIFKRSVWVSLIVTSLSELALNILFPGSSWSRPVTFYHQLWKPSLRARLELFYR